MPHATAASRTWSSGRLLRLGAFLYWGAFALIAVAAGRVPSPWTDPGTFTYPWVGVVETWVILGMLTWGLIAVLTPPRSRGAWPLLYGLLLLVLAYVRITDLPGHAYVPGYFAMVTLIMLILHRVALLVLRLVGRVN